MTDRHILPDPATEYGQAVRRRLREELVIWLTTVAPSGTPQPNPVWFLWQEDTGPEADPEWGDGSFLIYHESPSARLETLKKRPVVALNFHGYRTNEVTVFTGRVETVEGVPAPWEMPEYAAKYAGEIARITGDVRNFQSFMSNYTMVTRIRPTRIRGY